MKKHIVLMPIFCLPLMGANLTTLVSCKDNEENKPTFENDSWSNVALYADQGLEALKKHYGLETFIGLERTVNVFGVDHKVRVIGEDEDIINSEITSLKRASLTFQFSTILSQKDEDMGGVIVPIEMPFIAEQEGDRAYNRWGGSDVRQWLNDKNDENSFKTQLENAIGSNVLKTVKKNSIGELYYPQRSAKSNEETIFLLSLGDIYSAGRNQLPDEEPNDEWYVREANIVAGGWKPYSFFTKNIRYDFDYLTPVRCLTLSDPNGQNHPYWLRTGYTSQTEIEISEEESYLYYGQWVMGADGACGHWFLDNPYPIQFSSIGLAPCFCI